jgi:hypothetical protein
MPRSCLNPQYPRRYCSGCTCENAQGSRSCLNLLQTAYALTLRMHASLQVSQNQAHRHRHECRVRLHVRQHTPRAFNTVVKT